MSISCSVAVQGIFGGAKLVALLTIVARASNMFHFYVILHISCVLAYMIAISTLPSAR